MALVAVTFADAATFAPATTGTESMGGFGGLDFSIAENGWLKSSGMNYDMSNAVTLNSITLDIYSTWYSNNNMRTGFGIGIYEKTVEGSVTTWTLVGKTDWFAHTANNYTGQHEFDIDGTVTLNTESTYTIAFFAGSDYFANLGIGSTRNSMTGANEWKGSNPDPGTDVLAAVGLRGSNSGSTNMYTNGGIQTGRLPNIVLDATPVLSVPEPTSATLSLLALAGLAARRRRK